MSSACLGVQDEGIQDHASSTLFYKFYAASVQESYHLMRQLRSYGRKTLGLSVHDSWKSVIPVSVRVRLDRVSPCKRPDLGRNNSRLENVWNLYWCIVWCSSAQHSTMGTSCTVGWQRRGSYSRHVLGSIWGFDQVGCPGQERCHRQSIQFIQLSLIQSVVSLDTSMSSLYSRVPTPLCPCTQQIFPCVLFSSMTKYDEDDQP